MQKEKKIYYAQLCNDSGQPFFINESEIKKQTNFMINELSLLQKSLEKRLFQDCEVIKTVIHENNI